MRNNSFQLDLLDIQWIENIDEQSDLCAHGHVYVKIGDEIVADYDSLQVTVSAAALVLMRTIKLNYQPNDFSCQLLPCCGFFMIPNTEQNSVDIIGCPNGIDWTVLHPSDHTVLLRTINGSQVEVELEEYKNIIFDFADKVDQFYLNSQPKVLPSDETEKKGYIIFWEEWHSLRNG